MVYDIENYIVGSYKGNDDPYIWYDIKIAKMIVLI